MIRRLAPILAASLAGLVLLAAPALAGSSFTADSAEVTADEDHQLTLMITEPEKEDYGDTARVAVVVPSEFTLVSCEQEPLTWNCTADPETGRVTFTSTVEGSVANPDDTLQFTVHTPQFNGTYDFPVTQEDGAEEPNRARSWPTVTVIEGKAPPDESDDSGSDDTTDDSDSTSDDTTGSSDSTDDSDTTTDDGTTTDSGTAEGDETTSSDDTSQDTAADGDDDSTSDGDDSTTPRQTEGRSNGTRLEITPRRLVTDDPAISSPDVADEPAIAAPSDGDDEDDSDSGTATMTAIAGQAADEQDDAGGLAWQQLLGGALLVAGGAVVAARRWDVRSRLRGWDVRSRLRGWDPLARIRRWRS